MSDDEQAVFVSDAWNGESQERVNRTGRSLHRRRARSRRLPDDPDLPGLRHGSRVVTHRKER